MGENGLRPKGDDNPRQHRVQPQRDAKGKDDSRHEPQPEEPRPYPPTLPTGVGHSERSLLGVRERRAQSDEPAKV